MTEKLSRADIINYLIAVCVRNDVTPQKVTFPAFVRKVCAGKFHIDKYKAKSYIDTLISAWLFDKWKNLIEESPYLTPVEKRRGLKEHG